MEEFLDSVRRGYAAKYSEALKADGFDTVEEFVGVEAAELMTLGVKRRHAENIVRAASNIV